MWHKQLIAGLEERTEINPEDKPWKEIGKALLKFLGYVGVFTAFSVYVMLYLIFYVVGASWRGNRV